MDRFVMVVGLLFALSCDDQELLPVEIGIQRSPINVGAVEVGKELDFNVHVYNKGDQLLEITDMFVRGDSRCVFRFKGPDIPLLGPGDSAFVRGWYRPPLSPR